MPDDILYVPLNEIIEEWEPATEYLVPDNDFSNIVFLPPNIDLKNSKLTFVNCKFNIINLSHNKLKVSLSFKNCHFLHSINLRNSKVYGEIVFEDCTGLDKGPDHQIDIDGLAIRGNMRLSGCKGFHTFDLDNLKCEGEFYLEDSEAIHFTIENSRIYRNCLIQNCKGSDFFSLGNSRFDNTLVIKNSHFTNSVDHLNFQNLHVKSLFELINVSVDGPMVGKSITCGGGLIIRGLEIKNHSLDYPAVMDFSGGTFSFIKIYDLIACNDVDFSSCQVDVDFEILRGNNEIYGKFFLKSINIKNDCSIQGLTVHKSLDLGNAYIGNRLFFNPYLAGVKNHEFSFKYVIIKEDLILSQIKVGITRLFGVTIGRVLRVISGHFHALGIYPRLRINSTGSNHQYLINNIESSEIKRVTIKNVEVISNVDFSQIKVGSHACKELNNSKKQKKHPVSFVFSHSNIMGYLRISSNDALPLIERIICGQIRDYISESEREAPHKDDIVLHHKDNKLIPFKTEIQGDLNLSACHVDGSIDLRNTAVIPIDLPPNQEDPVFIGGRIILRDCKIVTNINMQDRFFSDDKIQAKHLITRCTQLVMDDLECGGNIQLYGLVIDDERVYNPGYYFPYDKARVMATGLNCKSEVNFFNPFISSVSPDAMTLSHHAQILPGDILIDGIEAHQLRILRKVFFFRDTEKNQRYQDKEGHISLDYSRIKNLLVYFENEKNFYLNNKHSLSFLGMEVKIWSFLGNIPSHKHNKETHSSKLTFENDHHQATAIDFSRLLSYGKYFETNTWYNVERYLRSIGQEDEADKVHVNMTKTRLEKFTLGKNKNVLRYYFEHIIHWPTGYGTQLTKPMYIFILPLFFVSACLFSNPQNVSPTFSALQTFDGYHGFYKSVQKDIFELQPTGPNKNNAPSYTIHEHDSSPQSYKEDYQFHQLNDYKQVITYSTLCHEPEKSKYTKHETHTIDFPLPHPLCEGQWDWFDGIELAITHHIPMISYVVEPAWEARSEPMEHDYCLFSVPDLNSAHKDPDGYVHITDKNCLWKMDYYLTPGHYTFFTSLLSWIIIPVYLFSITSRFFRFKYI